MGMQPASGGATGGDDLARQILDSTLDAVVIIDSAGAVRDWNARAEAIFGWTAAEAVGHPMAELIIPPRYREAHAKGLARFLASGHGAILGRRLELSALRRDGDEFPVELTISPIRQDGETLFIGFLRDQTEEKKTQGRLQVQNALYRLFSGSPAQEAIETSLLEAVCGLDPWLAGACWRPEGEEIRCSAFRERAGRSFPAFRAGTLSLRLRRGEGLPGRAQARKAPVWIPDAREEEGLPRLAAGLEEGLHSAFALPVLARGEVALVFEFFSRAPRPPDEELLAFASTLAGHVGLYLERRAAQDERESLMGQLERERARLSAILDFTPTPIVLADPVSGGLTFANKAAHTMAGGTMPMGVAPAEAPLGFRTTDKSGRELAPSEMPTARALRGETLADVEVDWHVQGRRHQLVINSATLRDGSGRPEVIVIAFQDLTHVKQVEEQLRQSQKMEAIGQLAGGIAHDFNNLLTAINGYSSMALEKLDPGDPLHGFMSEVLRSGERAAGLTRQLLAYSRKQVLETRLWDINVIVGGLLAMLRRIIGEDIHLVTELVPGPAMAKVDRGQVEQILLNLSLNSRDAMPGGGRLILETRRVTLDEAYVSAHPEASAGRHVAISVSDTGTGMSPEVKAKAFEPFFTTKEVGKGTGLGLSSVYGIVKQSGGSLSVYSEVGHGTTVTIYFPEASEAARAEGPAQPPRTYRGSETLLLVEDEEAVRRFAAQALEVQGYTVLKAANGREAMEILARQRPQPSLVVTDVVMPDMGGQVLAESIRTLLPDLPILFISGYTESSVIHRGLMDRPGSFLQKPFGPTDLARAVREALDRAAAAQRVMEKKASE